jgi:dolichyl-phosphate-mannose--protein O-mannosyl transferase
LAKTIGAGTVAQSELPEGARERSLVWWLPLLVIAGLMLRLVFIGNEGFKNDVQTFESWALSLAEHGFANFYSNAGFADYPPGYFYVLAIVGHIWEALFRAGDGGHYVILKALIKLPAILADLGVGVLLYAVVRRFASSAWALGASALYLLNPAVIFNSAAWGQVDSIAAGFALFAIYCLLKSDDSQQRASYWIVCGWLSFSYSLMVKPQAAVILPLMIAFAFVDPARRRSRVVGTAIGIVAALALALILTEPFHPSNPVAAFGWLLGRYEYGSNVYPYNSVNAFNLWAIRGHMWQPDSTYIGPVAQYVWGIVLVVAALALIVWRYVQDATPRALLEGCAIATLAFFVLATRMHERYSFDAVLFVIACIPLARRYLWSAIALTIVLYLNLVYSLQYLNVVTNHTPGVNAQNLWGPGTSLLALLAVAVFFWLGYQYLGAADAAVPVSEPASGVREHPKAATAIAPGARNWFDPREGLIAMRAPLDYVIMSLLGVGSFVLSFVGYWWPPDKVFDEIYFARAGEEYLQNMRIYENTHPPLTKLLVTFSMMLFGGMPKGHGLGGWTFLNGIIGHMTNGDNSYGWRFLDVLFGALVVMLLYVFAKRITGSTIFATITALFLTLDGMHFVQSRIATPEGFVVFFATLAVYAFYRFWISSQVADRAYVDVPEWGFAAGIGGSLAAGFVLGFIFHVAAKFDTATTIVAALYFACAIYLFTRYVLFTRWFGSDTRELTFAEGSRALRDSSGLRVYAADGGAIDAKGKVSRGVRSQNKSGTLVYNEAPLTIEYRKDGSVEYQTPGGGATYADDEIRSEGNVEKGRSSKLWLVLFTVALGCLVSSKWYGVMGFGVSFTVLILVALQLIFIKRRPLLWGNPRGFRLDAALVTIVFISMSVYALVWVPDLLRQSPDPNEIHNVNDVVYRQYTMFMYHDTLKATHPYSSKWWEWPLDYVPIAYFYQDHRKDQSNPNGCCIYEITSMPNPALLWFGLLCVPWVGVLAWRERNKGYALIVLTYLLQWLPWMKSPRITFAYHFYVDIPLICLCNAIVLQRIWHWGERQNENAMKWAARGAVGVTVGIVAAAFVYFYPILAAQPITWNAWHARMWFPTWIIGPG